MKPTFTTFVLVSLFTTGIAAQAPKPGGRVKLPLGEYQTLVQTATSMPRPAPVGYALGRAEVTVAVTDADGRASAQVEVTLAIEVLEDKWVLVPVLSSGVSIASATVDGEPLQLAATPLGLAWGTSKIGVHHLTLTYAVDAARFAAGYQLALPVPQAASTVLAASLPGSDLDVAVIPSAGTRVTTAGANTQISSTVPTTSAVAISWRVPSKDTHALSRALYTGSLRDNAVVWSAELSVELFNTDQVRLKLLPASVTLADVKVDGKPASIVVVDEFFATIIKGRGAHKVVAGFEVPVVRGDGPPHIQLKIPNVPVSRFDLTLPGKKEVNVEPAASVTNRRQGATTVSTVFVPMTDSVTLTWNEAIPEEVRAELRANASLYHAVHAEEGVLYVRAMIEYEVTRGETNVLTLEVPPDVAVNRVTAADNSVSDWRMTKNAQRGRANTVSVFLDRQATGTFTFDVFYERTFGTGTKAADKISVPLLKAVGVHRQRGMVALLASKEVTLKPTDDKLLTRVGENQLPAFVRQAIEMTIATTYKYNDDIPTLVVQAAPPERKEGKFDAQVDTLISLGDVTLRGAATVEVNVKSGSIMELELSLPAGVNFLNLTAPSLRTHKLNAAENRQTIDVQFTQEMEGQFRIEITYERIMADGETEVVVPTVAVKGAEVEQGRIAVEALTAVEVQPAGAEQLSSLDVKDLPQMLILKTTNPILLAYKYVHVEPPYKLALKITRHKEIDVQNATIDQARYQTLFTRDGLTVTTASLTVRNSRKQFLKIALPPESQVWSVFVDGKPEKPALETASAGKKTSGDPSVLIKIINSSTGFPVDVIYATPISKVRALGTISGRLPRPDMVVTQSRWDVFLPDGLSYGTPDSNMDVVDKGVPMTREAMAAAVGGVADKAGAQQMIEPLRITVPASGIRYAFEKLYANQADEDAEFSMPYASGGGAVLAELLTLIGACLLLVGIWLMIRRHPRVPLQLAAGGAGFGLVLLIVTLGYLGTSATLLVVLAVLAGVGAGARALLRALRQRHQARPPAQPGNS
jgi:hypothetical protein